MRTKQRLKMDMMQQMEAIEATKKNDAASQKKIKLASLLVKSLHNGSATKCDPSQAKNAKDKYCAAHLDANSPEMIDCLNEETFCFTCCDFEFGVQVKEKRLNCLQ